MPGNFAQPIQALTDAASITANFAVAKAYKVTVAGNRTLVFENPDADDFVLIRITQDGTGSRLITWPATVKWAGGSAPTLTITANKSDQILFWFDGTNFYDVSIAKNY
jgi:hypothetical protein